MESWQLILYFVIVIVGIAGLRILFRTILPKFATRLLIVVVPILLSAWLTVVAYRNTNDPESEGKRFNLGVDLAGGSILVYEVDPVFWTDQTEAFKSSFSAEQLASRIKTRVDPNNLMEVTIRPIRGDSTRPPRVEIVLPLKKDSKNSAGRIEKIKTLVRQQGQLEFRILAHRGSLPDFNDTDAINTAKTQLSGFVLEQDKVRPPSPNEVEYEWVECDKSEITTLGLGTTDATPEGFHERGGYAYYSIKSQRTPGIGEKDNNLGRHFVLTRLPLPSAKVGGDNMDPASIRPDMDGLKLGVKFGIRPEAQERFFELTREVGKQMAIIFDGKVISAPNLHARLSTGGIITMGATVGDTRSRVDDLARILQAGSLPAALRPDPVSEMTMGPGLGEDTIRKGTWSVAGAFVAVVIFMVIYYRFSGLVAVVALFANLLLTVAFLAFANAALTLPGLAGLVLMLALAVDANVLIYERLREEREKGANLAMAIRNAYDRAFPTIIDTHLTSIFTAIVLYVVGTDQLKGFGVTLTMGLVISLFTSLYITRLIFDIALSRNWLKDLGMMKLFSRPNIDFMRVRYYWFGATIILSIIGLAIFLYRGEQGLNIDFTGGTAYTFKFKSPVGIQDVRSAVLKDHENLPEPAVDALYRSSTVGGGPSDEFTVRTTKKDPKAVRNAIIKAFGDQLLYVEAKPTAVTNTPAEKQGPNKHNLTFDIAFTNKELTKEEVGKEVSQWFELNAPGTSKEYFRVEGSEKGERADFFKSVKVYFKLPPEKEKDATALATGVSATFNLPVSDRLENFDSQLASETQGRAIGAIVLSWIAIIGYLWFRFGNWTFGVAAVLCLVHDLVFTVGLIGVCHYIVAAFGNVLLLEDFKLDLPAVAALLTLVGYSVNDTIVVFDRIREVRGKNPLLTPQMINDSVNQTLSRTLLTSLITWLVVVVLYIFGGEGVKLFAFVMVVGVIIGTYSSIFVASPLLLILGEGQPKKAPPVVTSGKRQLQPV